MPTPRPIIAPMGVVKSGTVVRFEIRMISPMPVPTPATATAIGSPIASTEPNATISTTTANASPMNSDSGGSNSASALPPISTCRPASSGARSANSAPSSEVAVKSSSAERLIAAKATVPSALICVAPAGSYGLVTITSSKAATSSNIASIAARTVGSSTPDSVLNTIEPLWPLPKPPKCSSRASNPLRLSESGISNAELNPNPPTVWVARACRARNGRFGGCGSGWWRWQGATVAVRACGQEETAVGRRSQACWRQAVERSARPSGVRSGAGSPAAGRGRR